jgi:hypothetical protein
MTTVFVGWDVGAWYCRGKSRDALVALSGTSMANLTVVGTPFWNNLRASLNAGSTPQLLLQALALQHPHADFVVAIDTPLGWPVEFFDLVAGRLPFSTVPATAINNRLLHRETELRLNTLGFKKPLSSVTDMIGSQSTKGIFFLRKTSLRAVSEGVWKGSDCTAIETYPAPVKTSRSLGALFGPLFGQPPISSFLAPRKNATSDVEDALWCALVAAAWSLQPTLLVPPPSPSPRVMTEGWIWCPDDIVATTPAKRTKKK